MSTMSTISPSSTSAGSTSLTPLNPADRDLRQRELLPPTKRAACHALVIGVGAIGRQVALQLAAIGVAAITLIDFDTVDGVNLGPQAYPPSDLGKLKVSATASACRHLNPDVQVTEVPERFRRSWVGAWTPNTAKRVVFCCVDSISARKLIFESIQSSAAFFVDGRMAAEVIRILACANPIADEHYRSTLFSPGEAYGASCTAKSTVYTASIAAGLMLGQFARWLRALPLERDLTLNLLGSELIVA